MGSHADAVAGIYDRAYNDSIPTTVAERRALQAVYAAGRESVAADIAELRSEVEAFRQQLAERDIAFDEIGELIDVVRSDEALDVIGEVADLVRPFLTSDAAAANTPVDEDADWVRHAYNRAYGRHPMVHGAHDHERHMESLAYVQVEADPRARLLRDECGAGG